ncbi:MAG: two-component system response regulator NarL, partial [Hydrogenophilales bacterium 16-62-9]
MTSSAPQTLLIVDDHPLFRKGVIQLIQAEPAFSFVGEAASGKEGIQLAHSLRPDMILLDLNMKDMSGIEVLKAIKDTELDSRVIMLTVSDHAEDLMAALQAGADGYLLKDMEPEDLMRQLGEAAHGKITISESLTQLLV